GGLVRARQARLPVRLRMRIETNGGSCAPNCTTITPMTRFVAALLLLPLISCARKDPNTEASRLEKEFEQTMTGAVLAGKFQVGDKVHEDRYTISKASKLSGDVWTIQARVQYGKID